MIPGVSERAHSQLRPSEPLCCDLKDEKLCDVPAVGLRTSRCLDLNLKHTMMITSTPPLLYWQEPTLLVIHLVREWSRKCLPVC